MTSKDQEPSRMLRVGTVITPEEFAGMAGPSSKSPVLPARALLFDAPRHVLDAFAAPGQTVRHRLAVHETDDGLEHVMVMTIQRQGVLLHCIMPLSDASVQGYVADCIEQQSIRLVFALDNTRRFAVLELESALFGHENRLSELMKTASPNLGGVEALVTMSTELLELPPARPWVLELPVRHLVAVLAGSSVASALSRAGRGCLPDNGSQVVH